MTTLQLSQTELFTRGQFLTKSLHDEGRADDAVTVASLLAALKPTRKSKYLTTGEVARRIGVSRQTIVNWINRGTLAGTRIGGRFMISLAALEKFDELNAILADLDEDRPPATTEEINVALAPGRKEWTWVGKE